MLLMRPTLFVVLLVVTSSLASERMYSQERGSVVRETASGSLAPGGSITNPDKTTEQKPDSSTEKKTAVGQDKPARTPPQKPEPLNGANFIDDAQITRYAEYQVNQLIEDGDAFTCTALASQLVDATVPTPLISPGNKRRAETQLYRQASKSVVAILISRKHLDHWHIVLAATGFFVSDDGVVATNHHVFKQSDEYMFAMTSDYVVHPIRQVLGGNAASDVAFCQIESDKYHGLPLNEDAAIGSEVALISHPAGRYFFLSRGIVARRYIRPPQRRSIRGDEDSKEESHAFRRSSRWLTITAEFGKGSSGGPVFDRFGNVVGMATSTNSLRVGEKNEQVAQMNFRDCVPVVVMLESLSDKSPDAESNPTSTE